jgi:hypothetical protein
VYFEVLPKTSTGKIQKHVLRTVARERTKDSSGPASAGSPGNTDASGGAA